MVAWKFNGDDPNQFTYYMILVMDILNVLGIVITFFDNTTIGGSGIHKDCTSPTVNLNYYGIKLYTR